MIADLTINAFYRVFIVPRFGFLDAGSEGKNEMDSEWESLLLLAFAVAAEVGGGTSFAQASKCPATVLLIRHAEKLTDGRQDLSTVGFERAKLLPELFGGAGASTAAGRKSGPAVVGSAGPVLFRESNGYAECLAIRYLRRDPPTARKARPLPKRTRAGGSGVGEGEEPVGFTVTLYEPRLSP